MNESTAGVDVERLRQKAEEAEDLSRAIRLGEVDAFVIGKNEDDRRVLLLANAYQRYRYIVDRMEQGAVTVSAGGSVLFVNQRFVDLLGSTMSGVYGAGFESNFAEADRSRLARLLASPAGGKDIELDLVRSDGTKVAVHLHLAAVSDGYATILVTDLSQRNWEQAARGSLTHMREALAVIGRPEKLDDDSRKALDVIGAEIDSLASRIGASRPQS